MKPVAERLLLARTDRAASRRSSVFPRVTLLRHQGLERHSGLSGSNRAQAIRTAASLTIRLTGSSRYGRSGLDVPLPGGETARAVARTAAGTFGAVLWGGQGGAVHAAAWLPAARASALVVPIYRA